MDSAEIPRNTDNLADDSAEIPRNTDNLADEMFVDRQSEAEVDEGIGASNSTPYSVSSVSAMHINSDRIPADNRWSEAETDEGIGASNNTPYSVSSMNAVHISSERIPLHPCACEDEETKPKAIDVCDNHSHQSGTALACFPSPSPDAPLRPADEQDESDPFRHGSIQLRNPEVHQNGVSPQSVHHHGPRQEVFHLYLSEDLLRLNVRGRIYGDQERQPSRADMGNGLAVTAQAGSDENNDVMLSSPVHPIPTDVDVNPDADLAAGRANRKCATCFQRPRCTVSHPCGHRNNCLECARVMRRCSICQSPIQCYFKCPDCNCQ